MDKAVEEYRKRRAERLRVRSDGINWITTKNGEHIPLEDGKAVGGPLKGKLFSSAKSVSAGKKMGEKRKQIGTGGFVQGRDLTEFNKQALKSIAEETGYGPKEAKNFHEKLMNYFTTSYGDYKSERLRPVVNIIDDGLARMGAYDGDIYRGMKFSPEKKEKFESFRAVEPGDEISMASVSSWTSDKNCARSFAEIEKPNDSVMLVCKNNKSGVGVQHISRFRDTEAEVLSPSTSKWKVVKKDEYNKSDIIEDLVKEFEGIENKSDKVKYMLGQLKSQLKRNKWGENNGKFVVLEVEEI